MRVIGKILLCLLEAPVLFMALGNAMSGVAAACAAFVLLALLILPVDALQKRLGRVLPGKRRVIAAVVLFCIGFALMADGLPAADSIQPAPATTASAEPSSSPMAAEQTVQPSPDVLRVAGEAVQSKSGPTETAASTMKATTTAHTAKPAVTPKATAKATSKPTVKPTANPTAKPTAAPTTKATAAPIATPTPAPTATPAAATHTYVLNTGSHVFHKPSCYHVSAMNEENKKVVTATREEVVSQGYTSCGSCEP